MSDDLDDGFGVDDGGHAEPAHRFPREAGSLKIGKRRYAWGLIWEFTRGDDGKTLRTTRRAALQAARDEGHDLYCVATSGFYGLGSSEVGHASGMRPLAASIRGNESDLSEHALLAFRLDDGRIYILAIDANGYINPSTDIVVDHDDAAKDIFLSLRDAGTWRSLRAPADWGYDDTREESLADLLSASPSSCKLRNASLGIRLRRAAIIGGVAVVCYGLWYGYGSWMEYRDYQARLDANRQAAAAAAADAALRREAARNEAWPYDGKILGVAALEYCQAIMGATPIILPGYAMTSMQCIPDSGSVHVNFTMTQADATLVHVEQYVAAMTGMHPRILRTEDNGRTKPGVTLVYDYRDAFSGKSYLHYVKHAPAMSLDQEQSYLRDSFDALHLSRSLSLRRTDPQPVAPKPQSRTMPGMRAAPVVDNMVFRTLRVEISSAYTPSNFIKVMAPLKAFTVSMVEYADAGRIWRISGDIYENVLQSEINRAAAPVPIRH